MHDLITYILFNLENLLSIDFRDNWYVVGTIKKN